MLHAVILAGSTHKAYILGEPKCFIDMPSQESIVESVLHSIKSVRQIKDITVVGPLRGLKKLEQRGISRFRKNILLVPQGRSQQENMIIAKQAIVRKHNYSATKAKRLGLLFLTGDTPFRRQQAVEEFISQIRPKHDFVISLVPEEHILKYYSYFKKPLIPLYVAGRAGNYKETNLAYFNPDRIIGSMAQRFYSLRHTSRFKTMLALRKLVLSMGGQELLGLLQHIFFVRQWHKTFRRIAPELIHSPKQLYHKLDITRIIKLAEQLLGIQMDIVFSSYPDGYIDLDTRSDYHKIMRHYFQLDAMIQRDCAISN